MILAVRLLLPLYGCTTEADKILDAPLVYRVLIFAARAMRYNQRQNRNMKQMLSQRWHRQRAMCIVDVPMLVRMVDAHLVGHTVLATRSF